MNLEQLIPELRRDGGFEGVRRSLRFGAAAGADELRLDGGQTTTYEHWLGVVYGLRSETERASVLGETAERVYRLSSDTNQEER